MRNGRIIVNLILIVAAALLSFAVISSEKKPVHFINGYISDLNIDSEKIYKDTLINFYDPEPDWKPGKRNGTSAQPEVIGGGGILVDIDSGDILFEKNSQEKRKIASLVKIMTTTIALEHKKFDDKIYISQKASEVGENVMGVSTGEIYALKELLYGLILHSGNDSAYAIAEGVAGSDKRFAEWMNFKAAELGLKDTYFADASGLDDSSYSTPEDLVKLTRYALKNPNFKEIVGTVEKEVYGDTHKYVYMYNQTNLLTTYPGVAGVKTGFTEEAGLCLVTYAENGGKRVVGVVLNSADRKGDMVLMLDHGYNVLGVNIQHSLL